MRITEWIRGKSKLAVNASKPPDLQKKLSPPEPSSSKSNASPSGKKENATILLVDDDEDLRESGAALLRLSDYRVEVAKNGAEGLATYAAKRIDLVVSDLHMPELDGLGLLMAIKKLDQNAKVIIASAEANDEEIGKALNAGALAILRKPYGPKELDDAIARGLSS